MIVNCYNKTLKIEARLVTPIVLTFMVVVNEKHSLVVYKWMLS